MSISNPDRFLGRADVYASARPTYPEALGKWLALQGLLSGRVADVGAGTGLFTRLLLAHGAGPDFAVDAVEPNPEMRAQLETALAQKVTAGHLSVHDGTSEATALEPGSASLIAAAQAAHWFAPTPTVQEFRRILAPGGRVLLVWNDWRGVDTPFNAAYREVVTQFSREDGELISRVPENELPALMPGGFTLQTFDNPLPFTRERLHALAGSVSYLPAPHHPQFAEVGQQLNSAFEAYAEEGHVTLTYRTHAYLGELGQKA
ncbi:class I SAM-dependent methyltransferase [Deinococcus arenicola]|uniref:Class I SAM-dependent methyltransferase n=1 Tax=Deinococcus arenicola TaxID=2994950 RepID=A0ABU4DTY9_9DEIO|nr:class I SAM-dependent methyltransferase [Deinococcus sp. ZS9-10]MDV6375554.1 class I SAM-dependent methyltransferase [Deinococcus sp. ZS9-10]